MNNNLQQTINISTSTIFRVILIILGLVLLYVIRDIVLTVFIAAVIASAISGPVKWLQYRRVPRLLAVSSVYLFLILLVALIVTIVFPPLADQLKQLAVHLPSWFNQFNVVFQDWWNQYQINEDLQSVLSNFSQKLGQAAGGVFSGIRNIFGGIFSAGVILVISFYLSLRDRAAKRFVLSMTPKDHQHYVSDLVDRVESKIGGWLRGQIVLMFIVGILVYIGLSILGVKYALTLAILAGLLEIIPYLGPILSVIPALLLAFFQAPILLVWTALLYLLIQQLENYVLVPQVMKKTVGLSPIVIIIVMLIGAKLSGILGIVLSVPLAAAASEFIKDMREKD